MQRCMFSGASFEPTVLCLGVADCGTGIPEDESFRMLDAFVEAGGNWADTAHIYAAWVEGGWGSSERTLGRWLQSRAPQGFVVATKVGHPPMGRVDISRLSPEEIHGDFQECLERLQLDSVDLLYLHRDDPQVPVDGIMGALNELVQSGRVRALGASNWSPQRIEAANAYAQQHDLTGFCVSQPGWSLAEISPQRRGFDRTLQMDDQTLRWHRQTGFPVAAYSSQANGFFAYPLPVEGELMTKKQESLQASYGTPRNHARHGRATQLAQELGRTPNEIALAYVWSQNFPASAIIGPRRMDQLNDSLCSADLRLSLEQVAWLEEGAAG